MTTNTTKTAAEDTAAGNTEAVPPVGGLYGSKTERKVIPIPVDAITADWTTNRGRPEGQEAIMQSADLQSLIASLAAEGQRDPVSVYKSGPDEYTLVAGFCRHLAAQSLGWNFINAVVVPKSEAAMEQAMENLSPRAKLSLDGKAQTYAYLLQFPAFSAGRIAAATGEAEDSIRDFAAFANAPDILREAVLVPKDVSGVPTLGWAVARVILRDLRRDPKPILDLPAAIAAMRGMTFAQARLWMAQRGVVKMTAKMKAASDAQTEVTDGDVTAAAAAIEGTDSSAADHARKLVKYLTEKGITKDTRATFEPLRDMLTAAFAKLDATK